MQLPEYITKAEVQRVCKELGLSDWTALTTASVPPADARKVQELVGAEAMQITPEEFQLGLEVELEHGLQFADANVTNNHPVLTGMIVLAHLKEMLDYYARLEVAELEGDMLKAARRGDWEKLGAKYAQMRAARAQLAAGESADKGGAGS